MDDYIDCCLVSHVRLGDNFFLVIELLYINKKTKNQIILSKLKNLKIK